jgi:hypothetical protein
MVQGMSDVTTEKLQHNLMLEKIEGLKKGMYPG